MVAPNAIVRKIHAFLAGAPSAGDCTIGFDNGVLKERRGLLLPDEQALVVDDLHQRGDALGLETPEEIASGGGVGDALGAQGVQKVFIVAEQFKVRQSRSASQDVVGK